MNLIKKHILKLSLSYYGINNVKFDKEYIEDVFGNLKLYSLEKNGVVVHTGSIKHIDYEDFDTFIGELSFCIYNSMMKGYYEPTYIINRKREINNGKIKEGKSFRKEINSKGRIISFEKISLRVKRPSKCNEENTKRTS